MRWPNRLRRLCEAGLARAWRHRGLTIFALAEPGLRVTFSMLNGLRGGPTRAVSDPPEAATCYDHLAGRLGAGLLEHPAVLRCRRSGVRRRRVKLGPIATQSLRLGVDIPDDRHADAGSPAPWGDELGAGCPNR